MSATAVSQGVARELRAVCGEANVRERPPGGTYVSPATADEVAAVLALANEQHLTVFPAGGSTECSAANSRADILLHLNRLIQVEHYDHADLTVGVGAGMTVAQLNAMVGADNLMFAGDPPLPQRCTLGGLLATARHGPLRHGFGAVRDYCIGVRFVTGEGRRAKGGGRVVKNVAGYDLMKLLIGSYGTLAVITSASFKLFPAPRQTRTFLAEFKTAQETLTFRDQVMRSPLSPMCLELVSPEARKLMRPEMSDDAWVLCLRAAGSDAVLARYRKELGATVTRELEGEGEARMWRAIEDFPPASGGMDVALCRTTSQPPVHLTVPPREVIRVLEVLDEVASPGDIRVASIGRVGIGHVMVVARPINPEAPLPVPILVDALRERLGPQANIKVEAASNPWPVRPANLAQMRAVKLALDPNNILRGREIF